MALRLKRAHYNDLTKTGKWVEKHPIPLSRNFCARSLMTRWLNAEAGRKSKETEDKIAGLLSKEALGGRVFNCPDLITIRLGHGDIVVMHGAEVQRYFEVGGSWQTKDYWNQLTMFKAQCYS